MAAIRDRPNEILDDCKWNEMDSNIVANLHLALVKWSIVKFGEENDGKRDLGYIDKIVLRQNHCITKFS